MKRYAWTLILPIFWGCAGKNVVAGDEKSKAENLAADLPSWCEQTCQRLDVCDNPDNCDCQGDVCECKGVQDDCVSDCQTSLGKFAKNESCAATGRAYMSCLDSRGCELLTSSGSKPSCLPDEAEFDACEDDEDDDPPVANPPNGEGGMSGTHDGPSSNGSWSDGGPVPGAAAAPSVGQTVTCDDGGASGGGGPVPGGGPYVTCQETHSACTDNHEYSWICVDDAQGHGWCTCFLDGDPVGALAPALVCPSVAEVNVACSWNLQSF